MTTESTFKKDPSAVLPYTIDWSSWLITGDTIATSDWIFPSGITEDSDSKTTTTTTAVVSGGTVGTRYAIVNRITTANGYTDDRTIYITVEEK